MGTQRLIRRSRKWAIWLSLSLLTGVLADKAQTLLSDSAHLESLRERVRGEAEDLELQTMPSRPAGAADILGLNEAMLKSVALGHRRHNNPEAVSQMRAARRVLGADGVYIINQKGVIVAHELERDTSSRGVNVTFRPYWQQAMQGINNVYAAVGSRSNERGLYVAAPIYATNSTEDGVIGVVAIKMLAHYLDSKLAALGPHALLISPQGVVFASTHKNWLFRTENVLSSSELEAIRALKQFGRLFEREAPQSLPFSPNKEFQEYQGRRFAMARYPVYWNDPAGPWSVVALQETTSWLPSFQRFSIDILFAAVCLSSLLWLAYRRKHVALEQVHKTELQIYNERLEKNVQERTADLVASQLKLEGLIQTGLELGREHERLALEQKIVQSAKELLHCDIGMLYMLTEDKTLKLVLGTEGSQLPLFETSLYDSSGNPNERSITAWCFLHNETVLIDNIDTEERFDLSHITEMDRVVRNKTTSILAIPLSPRRGEVIGVLKLLNASDPVTGAVTPFNPSALRFLTAMVAQAAVALDNFQLLESQKEMLEALIKLVAVAIDAKSHYTGGHCERVPELGVMLAEAANDVTEGPLAEFGFKTEDQWREFRIGAWLHDCGKVTTPEYVVDKSTKLETIYNRIHEIRMRFEVLLRDAKIAQLEALAAGTDPNLAEAAFEARRAALMDDFSFIASCNLGGEFMAPEMLERLKDIAEETWERHFDDRIGLAHEELSRMPCAPESLPVTEKLLADKSQHIVFREESPTLDEKWNFKVKVPEHLYNRGEVYNLRIGRGTLTEEERFKINEHVIQSLMMLEKLPLPRNMRRVPEYAGTHHETLIGTGYPRKLTAAELSIPTRIIAIADIFEALTAWDRPYKKPKTLSESIEILATFKKNQHIDPDIFDLFLTSGIYLRYAKKYLRPEQIDEVDINRFL